MSEENSGADDELIKAMTIALGKALDKLNAMREIEGGKLSEDMLARMDVIEKQVKAIGRRAPLVAQNYGEKLEIRIKKNR